MNKEDEKILQDALDNSMKGIKASKIFLALMSPGCEKDPIALMQLGAAIMLDKPISLVIPSNQVVVPEKLRRIASRIEFYEEGNQDSMNQAALRCCKHLVKNQTGESAKNV